MVIHQLVPNFVPGDATGQSALHFRLLLRRLGHTGDLYSGEVHPSLQTLVHPVRALSPRPTDWVLYHHGIASSLSGRLLHLPCHKGLVFHNISPEAAYRNTPLHESLLAGRAQLSALAPFVEWAIGVSEYNCRELREAGYRNVHRVPLFIEPSRLGAAAEDRGVTQRLLPLTPYVLAVSRVVPHKRFEDVLSFFEELRRIRPDVHLVVAGGYAPGDAYFRSLSKKARQVGQVTFLGRVSNEALVSAYRHASLFVSMSEHEGFGVPFLEAFATRVPVLAFSAGAVAETLGGRGVAFTEKRFAALAEVAREILETPSLRQSLVEGQAKRLAQLSAGAAEVALKKALDTVRGAPGKARRPSRRPRIGLVVQRFGPEITGGAEAHARAVALRLAPHWDLTVLTTCARDHLTWANELPEGPSRDGPLSVLRFPTRAPRQMRPFNRHSRHVFGRPLDRLAEENWIAHQGPDSPALLEHLGLRAQDYDGFVFFTYLYTPTVLGLPLVADRSLLVPTAHDEPPFWMDAYLDVFERPRALLCNTPEEAALIQRRTDKAAKRLVVGVGVEPPDDVSAERFRKKHGVAGDYLLYVGRVEEGKGVGELLSFHRRLGRSPKEAVTLVLAGASSMKVKGPQVRYLGRISEEDKFDALSGALATVVPSRYESLSLLTLESMSVGTPVLGQKAGDVVRGQIERSRAGMAYGDFEGFRQGLQAIREGRPLLGERGKRYAASFRWSKVVDMYLREMNEILKERP